VKNIDYFDPVSGSLMEYPIKFGGRTIKYEKVIDEDDPESDLEFDQNTGGQLVITTTGASQRFQTNRLVATTPERFKDYGGPGVSKIDLKLYNWHADEWDLYCYFADRGRVAKRIKFKLPMLESFDVSDGETNLFEVKIPYFRPRAAWNESGMSGLGGMEQHYTDGGVLLRFFLEDLAQMVMYEVGEGDYPRILEGAIPESYEGKTPYMILEDVFRSSKQYKFVVDDLARRISVTR
jgi:hypothetical protein